MLVKGAQNLPHGSGQWITWPLSPVWRSSAEDGGRTRTRVDPVRPYLTASAQGDIHGLPRPTRPRPARPAGRHRRGPRGARFTEAVRLVRGWRLDAIAQAMEAMGFRPGRPSAAAGLGEAGGGGAARTGSGHPRGRFRRRGRDGRGGVVARARRVLQPGLRLRVPGLPRLHGGRCRHRRGRQLLPRSRDQAQLRPAVGGGRRLPRQCARRCHGFLGSALAAAAVLGRRAQDQPDEPPTDAAGE
jgi:putative oxidoreductase